MDSSSPLEDQRNPTLVDAWQRFAEYDYNANLTSNRFSLLRKWILILGVLATTLALTHELYLTAPTNDFLTSLSKPSRVLVVLLPITVSVLLTGTNKFSRGINWIILRGSSEAIKNEIYRFRTRTGKYGEDVIGEESIEMVLARKVRSIGERLMKTEVNQSGLQEYKGVLPPKYGAAEGDSGFNSLSPDDYLKFRLDNQLHYYKRKSAELDKKIRRLNWQIFLFGGLGTLLAALEFEVWIAVTTAIVGAITSFIEYNQFDNSLRTFNQAATDLESVRIWWRALPEAQRDTKHMFDRLVESAESVLQTEQSSWAQNLQDALAELLEEGQQQVRDIGIPELPPLPHFPDDTYTLDEDNFQKESLELSPEEVSAMLEMDNYNYDEEETVSGSMGEGSSDILSDTTSDMFTDIEVEIPISDENLELGANDLIDLGENEGYDPIMENPIEDSTSESISDISPDILASAGLEFIEVEDKTNDGGDELIDWSELEDDPEN